MIAYCGLDCAVCPAYLATVSDDDAARQRVAAKWAAEFGAPVTAADINCDGCSSDSERLYAYCGTCGIRACARGRQVINCAHCGDYMCGILEPFVQQVSVAKESLAAERARLGGDRL